MKTIAKQTFVLLTILIIKQLSAQTWNPVYDYDRNLYGFENEAGDRKDVKYKSAELINGNNISYIIVGYGKEEDEIKYGILDGKTLEIVFPIQYDKIENAYGMVHTYMEGALDQEGYRGDGTAEIFDYSLKKIYNQKLTDQFVQFKNGLASFRNEENKEGVIDSTGKIVIPFEYNYVRMFDDGYISVQKDYDAKCAILDVHNKVVIPAKNIIDFTDYQNGVFIAKTNSSIEKKRDYVVLDTKGKELFKIPAAEGDVSHYLSFSFYNKEIGCTLFDFSKSYQDAKGSSANFYGMYDAKGNIIVPVEYYNIRPFSCNLIRVSNGSYNNETVGVYDLKSKKLVVPVKYYSIEYNKDEQQFKAYKDNTYKQFDLLDLSGKVISKKVG